MIGFSLGVVGLRPAALRFCPAFSSSRGMAAPAFSNALELPIDPPRIAFCSLIFAAVTASDGDGAHSAGVDGRFLFAERRIWSRHRHSLWGEHPWSRDRCPTWRSLSCRGLWTS